MFHIFKNDRYNIYIYCFGGVCAAASTILVVAIATFEVMIKIGIKSSTRAWISMHAFMRGALVGGGGGA